MKIELHSSVDGKPQRGERGMAVIIVLIIVSILLIYVGGNLRTLHLLRQDLKQIEQKQVSRFKKIHTNSVAGTNPVSMTPVLVLQPSE